MRLRRVAGHHRHPAMPTTLILLGRFGRAHGVKGEVRLQSFTADPVAILRYGPLSTADGRRSFTLAAARAAGEVLIARVEGVTSREQAEALNGVELFAPRERLPPPDDEDEFLMADLVGCATVTPAGVAIGVIIGVANYGAGDLLDIRLDGRTDTVLLPFTKAFVPVVDVANGRVVIDPPEGLFDESAPRGEEPG
jgi:16S rRNA processing protein RimM